MQNTHVTRSSKRIMSVIRALPDDVREIADMINEHGAVLIEDGFEPANILSLVNMQLQRLIEGTMNKCLNPACSNILHKEGFSSDKSLVMTCSEECSLRAISIAAENIIAKLRQEIPELEIRIKKTRRSMASSAVRQGDVADHAQLHNDDPNERLLLLKKIRIGSLREVLFAISSGEFKMECNNKRCGEEIPISALISTPEIGYCVACRR